MRELHSLLGKPAVPPTQWLIALFVNARVWLRLAFGSVRPPGQAHAAIDR